MQYMALYLVATPIGNLEDITLRALRILKQVDLIAAEDTRHTKKLLSHHQIKNQMISYNDRNKGKKTSGLVKMLRDGKGIALVSDAGTPGISDPGFYLVRECIKNNIEVVPIPGANALLAALTASGMPTDKFSFYGFLPKKEKAKSDFFNLIKSKEETIVVYESPYRLIKTLRLMVELIPNHNVVVARELTKKFEEVLRTSVSQIQERFSQERPRGEFVVVI